MIAGIDFFVATNPIIFIMVQMSTLLQMMSWHYSRTNYEVVISIG